jgi:hypothetical protein
MKMLISIASVLSLSILRIYADGPPVLEDGTITGEHILMKIDPSQIKQVEKTRVIDLSSRQHALLMKYGPQMPKRFVVVTPHYNDCTCELIYLIWNRTDTVAFPLYEVDYFKEVFAGGENSSDYQDLLTAWTRDVVVVDTKGNMYYGGKTLDGTALDDLFKRIAGEKGVYDRWISINLPPYLKTDYEEKVKSAVDSITKAAKKYRVNAHIGG